tara:strand:- start:1640 stop:2125 length:486 start_codon:yes stop_codon:yes gene_type:complete
MKKYIIAITLVLFCSITTTAQDKKVSDENSWRTIATKNLKKQNQTLVDFLRTRKFLSGAQLKALVTLSNAKRENFDYTYQQAAGSTLKVDRPEEVSSNLYTFGSGSRPSSEMTKVFLDYELVMDNGVSRVWELEGLRIRDLEKIVYLIGTSERSLYLFTKK